MKKPAAIVAAGFFVSKIRRLLIGFTEPVYDYVCQASQDESNRAKSYFGFACPQRAFAISPEHATRIASGIGSFDDPAFSNHHKSPLGRILLFGVFSLLWRRFVGQLSRQTVTPTAESYLLTDIHSGSISRAPVPNVRAAWQLASTTRE